MGFRNLFIAGITVFVAAIIGFFVISRPQSQPAVEEQRAAPTVASRFSLPPASRSIPPPSFGSQILRSNPVSSESSASLSQSLPVQEFIEPILDTFGDAAREGRLPALPNAFQLGPLKLPGGLSDLPRYEDLVKPGAPFLFPPRYVHYIRVIRRIMVLNGIVTDEFYPEIQENRDMVAVMEQFASYVISLQPVDSLARERQRQQLLDGIHLDLRLLASEYPRGFPRPEPRNKVMKGVRWGGDSAVCSTRPEEEFFSSIFDILLPKALAQEGGVDPFGGIGAPSSPSLDADLAAGVDIVGGEGTLGDIFGGTDVPGGGGDGAGATESANAAVCIVTSAVGEAGTCWREAGPNPALGTNLWAPCCNCSVPTPYGCVPIGCKNLVCRKGNVIWDPGTGICGCDGY